MDSSGRERETKSSFRGPTRKLFQVLHNLQPLGGLPTPEYIFLIENTLFGIVGGGGWLPISFDTVSNSKHILQLKFKKHFKTIKTVKSIKTVKTLKSLI